MESFYKAICFQRKSQVIMVSIGSGSLSLSAIQIPYSYNRQEWQSSVMILFTFIPAVSSWVLFAKNLYQLIGNKNRRQVALTVYGGQFSFSPTSTFISYLLKKWELSKRNDETPLPYYFLCHPVVDTALSKR